MGLFYGVSMKLNQPHNQIDPTSEQDVRDLVSFFELLIEIDRDLKLKEKNNELPNQ